MVKKTNSFLFLSLLFSVSLLLIRIKVTHSFFYTFLIWNLFLAAVPLLITIGINATHTIKNSRFLLFIFFIIWLLFLPNSPYIITDFLHFKLQTKMTHWFDVLMLTSFAFNGLILGLISMVQMQKLISNFIPSKKTWIVMLTICLLCGFGIYLGRFLRYNSWDIITNPSFIFHDIMNRITYPLQHPKTWGITFGFGAFLYITYKLLLELTISTKEI